MYQVIIIGYGPVGMTAANFLGKLGYKVAVLEKNISSYQIPRAIHLDDESLRILQQIGLDKKLLPFLKPVKGMRLFSEKGNLLLETTKKETSYFKPSNLFYQPDLEKVLQKAIKSFENIEVFWNTEVSKVHQEKEFLEVITNQQKFQSKYVFLCTGANSQLRNDLGIKLKSFNFERANLKVDVKLKSEEKLPQWIQKHCKAGEGAMVFLNSIRNHKRWEFTLPKNIEKKEAEEENYILDKLSKVISPEKVEIEHVAVYRFKTAIAEEWQQNHIFLLGDVAHQMPPYIGQGMCAGLRDVHNLVWKLDAIEKQLFSEELLKTYQIERENHVRQVILLTILLGKVFTTNWGSFLSFFIVFIPKKFRKIKVKSLKIKKGFWNKGVLCGQWFPQFELENIKKERKLLDDFLEQTWKIIFFEKELSLVRAIKFPVKKYLISTESQVLKENSLIDFSEKYKNWFQKNKVKFVVLRPDNHIFGAGKNSKQLLKTIKNIEKYLPRY